MGLSEEQARGTCFAYYKVHNTINILHFSVYKLNTNWCPPDLLNLKLFSENKIRQLGPEYFADSLKKEHFAFF